MENLAQDSAKEVTKKKPGYVYILTNNSMPEYIKIGMTTGQVEERVKQLNGETGVPLPCYIFAKYKVDDAKTVEKSIHTIIDTIYPSLRAIEKNQLGKDRVREFFRLKPDAAYVILAEIAGLRNDIHNLERIKETDEQKKEEALIKNIDGVKQGKKRLSFKDYKISVGSELTFVTNSDIVVKVMNENDTTVQYNGQNYSLSKAALIIAKKELNWKADTIQGPAYFMYNGKKLTLIREELEAKEVEAMDIE